MLQQRNPGILEIDVHRMTKYQAKVCIDNLLKKVKSDIYRIRVIHGYHNGTELKDMVRRDYIKHPKIIKIENNIHEGITDLILRNI
jgi:DNA-nicking Smr family endonuclease